MKTETVAIVSFFFNTVGHLTIWLCDQGLSGQPLSGPDIGGFAGNATPKLFGRWMGVGALFPFSRGHTETGSIDHEPWSFGEEVPFMLLKLPFKHVY